MHTDLGEVVQYKGNDHRNENAQEKGIEEFRAPALADKCIKGPEVKDDGGHIRDDPVSLHLQPDAAHKTKQPGQYHYQQREQEGGNGHSYI